MFLNKYIFQHCIKKYLFELILEIVEVLKSILKTEVTEHKGQDVILISFPYDKTLIEELKQALPAKWSASKKAWYVPDRQHFRSLFNLPPKTVGKNALLAISKTNQPALSKLQERSHAWRSCGFSEHKIVNLQPKPNWKTELECKHVTLHDAKRVLAVRGFSRIMYNSVN